MLRRSIPLFLLLAPSLLGQATTTTSLKANYTKHEYLVTMRDGKRLFTQLYVPKDNTKKYPILLNRTPYSCAPYGEDNYRADLHYPTNS